MAPWTVTRCQAVSIWVTLAAVTGRPSGYRNRTTNRPGSGRRPEPGALRPDGYLETYVVDEENASR